jgi:hypothetical protein
MPLRRRLGLGLPLSGRRRAVLSGAAAAVGEMHPPGRAREDSPAALQPFSPQQEAALHVAGIRICLDARSARRAARQAAYGTPEAPGGLSADQGRDQAAPAPARPGVLPTSERTATGALQLLRREGQLWLAVSLLQLGHGLCMHMAQPTRWQAAAFSLGAVFSGSRPGKDSTSPHYGSQTPPGVRVTTTLCTAEARPTEEPDAGTLHVRVCTGGAG